MPSTRSDPRNTTLASDLEALPDIEAAADLQYRARVQTRRRRALQLLMGGGAVCALVIFLLLLWFSRQPQPRVHDLTWLSNAMLLMAGAMIVAYVLSRLTTTEIASIWLLTTGVLIISISDEPRLVSSGPALVAYVVPILGAGVLLSPWTAFLFAGLSSLAVFTTHLLADPTGLPPFPAALVFFMVALIAWNFARSLDNANRNLSRANARIARSEADLRLLFASNPLPMAVVDASNFDVLEVNSATCTTYGYSKEELQRISPLNLQANAQAAPPPNAAPYGPFHGEQKHVTKSGSIIDVAITTHPIHYAGRAALLVIALDITERKRAEQQLYLMHRVVDQSPISIAVFAPDGKLEFVNRKFVEMTGYTRDEIANTPAQVLHAGGGRFDAEIGKALAEGREWHGEALRQHRNGGSFWEAVWISRITDATGTMVHLLAIAEDVTARHEAEDALRMLNAELERRVEERTSELRRANIELERSARLKDEFLATMSHELRTPLTGVLAGADLLADDIYGSLNERQRRSVSIIQQSASHLLELINGVLDLSKIEAGGIRLELQPIRVADICTAALSLVREQALQKHQVLTHTLPSPDLVVQADARRLKQMLVNLLGNAVKFTPEHGSIGLEVTVDPGHERLLFTVWDTGIGIAPDQLPRLFQPFTQVDSGLNREYGGTGLGLALVRRLAELHGGGVGVESTPAAGSRFTIYLPWTPAPIQAVKPEADEQPGKAGIALLTRQGQRPQVLVAEDSRLTIEVLINLLESVHCDFTVVQRGTEAVRAAVERQPDLILMDIQMPHLDGLGAIRQIRSHPDAQVASIPIIALTALAMPGDRERCLAAGANAYISKPFPVHLLLDTMAQLLASPPASVG